MQVLSLLISSYLYSLCQALDLRALRFDFNAGLKEILAEELSGRFRSSLSVSHVDEGLMTSSIYQSMCSTFDKTTTMDCADQMNAMAASGASVLIDHFISVASTDSVALGSIAEFRSKLSSRAGALLQGLRKSYLIGERGDAPAAVYMGKTQAVYNFIRTTLGIKMHGADNLDGFTRDLGENDTVGQSISVINEVSLRNSTNVRRADELSGNM